MYQNGKEFFLNAALTNSKIFQQDFVLVNTVEEILLELHSLLLYAKAVFCDEMLHYPSQLYFFQVMLVVADTETIAQIMYYLLFPYILKVLLFFSLTLQQQFLSACIFVRLQHLVSLFPLEHSHTLYKDKYLFLFHLHKQFFLKEYSLFSLNILLLFLVFVLYSEQFFFRVIFNRFSALRTASELQ